MLEKTCWGSHQDLKETEEREVMLFWELGLIKVTGLSELLALGNGLYQGQGFLEEEI